MVIKMECDKYSKEIEFILREIKTGNRGDISSDIYSNYFSFRYNFFKYIGVSELSNLCDYQQQVTEYIEQVSPFCFMNLDDLTDFPETLTKYILLLGGSENDVEEICKILKNTPVQNVDVDYYMGNYENSFVQRSVNLNDILGTSILSYQKSNLYDVLEQLEDKSVDNYMWYLCINNVFNNKEKCEEVFAGVGLIEDENSNLYVMEGNHRIFSYLALLKIRDYLGIESESRNFSFEKTVLKYITKTDGQSSRYR